MRSLRRAGAASGSIDAEDLPLVAGGAGEQAARRARRPRARASSGWRGSTGRRSTAGRAAAARRRRVMSWRLSSCCAARIFSTGTSRSFATSGDARPSCVQDAASSTASADVAIVDRLARAALRESPCGRARVRAGQPSSVPTLMPPADSPKIVTSFGIAAERLDVVAHPLERRDLVEQAGVRGRARSADAPRSQEAERAEPVVDRDDDHVAAPRERCAVVDRLRAGADHEGAAVDPDHHGRGASGWRRPARRRSGRGSPRAARRCRSRAASAASAAAAARRRRTPSRRARRPTASTFSGARKRRSPTGGFAYGMPRNTRTPSRSNPSSLPRPGRPRSSPCAAPPVGLPRSSVSRRVEKLEMMRRATSLGCSIGNPCVAPAKVSTRAFGIAAAISRVCSGLTASCSPTSSSVRALDAAEVGVAPLRLRHPHRAQLGGLDGEMPGVGHQEARRACASRAAARRPAAPARARRRNRRRGRRRARWLRSRRRGRRARAGSSLDRDRCCRRRSSRPRRSGRSRGDRAAPSCRRPSSRSATAPDRCCCGHARGCPPRSRDGDARARDLSAHHLDEAEPPCSTRPAVPRRDPGRRAGRR